jgi:hypothetical protein
MIFAATQSPRGCLLSSKDNAAELMKRQAELETAMKRPGGARVIEENELHSVKRKLGTLSLAARASRCSLADLAINRSCASPSAPVTKE